MARRQPPPFPPEAALVTDSGQHLPGEPRVSLNNRQGVNTFLYRELDNPLFEELFTWCEILASKRGDNISSLHRQLVKGRKIMPSEDPRLHMVWDKYKIYIKPIPACLLSHTVWERFLGDAGLGREHEESEVIETKTPSSEPTTTSSVCFSSDPEYGPPAEASDLSERLPYPSSSSSSSGTQDASALPAFDRRVALGFLRSYAYLIRHASDLKMAREVGLLPETDTPITWSRWAIFISHFQSIPDSAVSRRYQFGHLRMGRLDWAVRMRFLHGLFASTRKTTPHVSNENDGNIENGQQTAAIPSTTKEARRKGPIWYYLQPYWSIPVLLEGMFNYFLFAFATASLLLSAMQVSLAIPPGAYLGLPTPSLPNDAIGSSEQGEAIPGGRYILGLWRFFWIFSSATIYLCGVLCLGMLAMLAHPYLKKFTKVVLRGIWRRRGGKGE